MGAKYPAEISGGMRKRVAIARALVTEPEIVFFDEPTTGLDPVLVNTIHHLILDLHRRFRFTAVVVSHEIPEIFEIADTVAMLHEGRIVEVGPPAADPELDESGRPAIHQGRAGQFGGTLMERTRVNIAVGIFVMLGILALGYLSISPRPDLVPERPRLLP